MTLDLLKPTHLLQKAKDELLSHMREAGWARSSLSNPSPATGCVRVEFVASDVRDSSEAQERVRQMEKRDAESKLQAIRDLAAVSACFAPF